LLPWFCTLSFDLFHSSFATDFQPQESPKTTKRFELAKAFIDSDGGLTKPDLLADDFLFVGGYYQG